MMADQHRNQPNNNYYQQGSMYQDNPPNHISHQNPSQSSQYYPPPEHGSQHFPTQPDKSQPHVHPQGQSQSQGSHPNPNAGSHQFPPEPQGPYQYPPQSQGYFQNPPQPQGFYQSLSHQQGSYQNPPQPQGFYQTSHHHQQGSHHNPHHQHGSHQSPHHHHEHGSNQSIQHQHGSHPYPAHQHRYEQYPPMNSTYPFQHNNFAQSHYGHTGIGTSPEIGNYQPPMNSQMFRKYGYQIIDWAVNYMQTLDKRNPTTDEKPGWLWKVVPNNPPQRGESFDAILRDLEAVACHGMAHWQHRQFFAYFPAGNSWPSILGDILSNATGSNGQCWLSSPVVTELETIVMDWCCKFLGLPKFFLSSYNEPGSEGQGILQCSASEAIFYSLIWARQDAIKKLRTKHRDKSKADLLNMLVAYCSNECHCCVERGAMMGCVRMRKLKADAVGVVRSYTLRQAIFEDMKKGLVPFFHCAIIGSTGVTCCDDLMEVGPLCHKFGIWLHVDAAYAGSSFVLPEMSHLKQGYEYASSTNINTNKWMMCNFEASLHWVRFRQKAVECFAGDISRVKRYPNGVGPDLRHYGMSHSRRLRALKLYFVIRNYGVQGIRRYIRNHINLAQLFEMYVRRDHRFEIVGGPFKFGLITFRLKGYNSLTSQLLDAMNASHKIHMVSSHFHNQVVIRFALCAEHANEKDVDRAWRTIDEFASVILRRYEREHAADRAMKNIYHKQREHDEMRRLFPDVEVDREEAEAADILKRLLEKGEPHGEDEYLFGSTTTARDGGWGAGADEIFTNHDRYLHDHPEIADEDEYKDPEVTNGDQTMLHSITLQQTLANSPESKKWKVLRK